ncbi:MAG: hypothetical protein CMJ83_19935 [Planctomycetes bacterium]|nr:hypothetical protein [Planctomycetota bacterium]
MIEIEVHALATLLPVLYLIATFLYGMELGGPKAPKFRAGRHVVNGILLVVHLGWLLLLWQSLGHFPVADPWTAVSFMALSVMLVYLPIELMTGAPTTGVFVVGFAFTLQLIGSCLLPLDLSPSGFARSPFFAVHVATALLATAALLLSGFFGALYLVLLRQIRAGRFGVLFRRLPDLESLSRLNRGVATLGFVLLTVGVNIGIWWAHSGAVERLDYTDPKVLPVLVLWLLFGVIGASPWIRGLTGRRAAVVAVLGASLLIVTLIVTFLPLGSIHEF